MIDGAVAKRIRLLGLDVDGVLTDNAVHIGEIAGSRVEFKRFDIQDGLGHALMAAVGIEIAWISGRVSASTAMRGQELKVDTVLQVAPYAKVATIEAMLAKRGMAWNEMAFVGDDLADFPVLERVGLPIAVANAREEIKALCHWTTNAVGGHGAVREVIDALLAARGETVTARERYLSGQGVQS